MTPASNPPIAREHRVVCDPVFTATADAVLGLTFTETTGTLEETLTNLTTPDVMSLPVRAVMYPRLV